jgi:hypothetical protein
MVIASRRSHGSAKPANARNPDKIAISAISGDEGTAIRLRRIHRDA